MDLDGLGAMGLEQLRVRSLGKAEPPGASAPTPFSVVSFLQLDAADDFELTEGNSIHRLVDALSGWSATAPFVKPKALADCLISRQVYARARGRTVWFPEAAMDPQSDFMSCFHRTLVFLSLQLDGLGWFVNRSANVNVMQFDHSQVARGATSLLGRLHGQTGDTYRSPSAPFHIAQNGWLPPIDGLRQRFGWPTIRRP
jgi:hypothetical protein